VPFQKLILWPLNDNLADTENHDGSGHTASNT
jgi:hypothetical protein